MSETSNVSFQPGDIVTILDKIGDQSYQGKMIRRNVELKIPKIPQYGFEVQYFVKFDKASYKSILLQGWHIYASMVGQIKRCIITSISDEELKVQLYDPANGHLPLQYDYTIKYENIDSILISPNAFTITKV
uniref:Uncharacterized protein n=1 Tax=viral metagenome TaxID=1070528 RepID=A0A6C0LFK4_9ZZZZ